VAQDQEIAWHNSRKFDIEMNGIARQSSSVPWSEAGAIDQG